MMRNWTGQLPADVWRRIGRSAFLAFLTVVALRNVGSGQEIRDRDASNRNGAAPAMPDPARAWPPSGGRPPVPFKLGIMAQNTPTGVQVTQVLTNSVAQRAGLEVGDTIVAVDGYQVGYVSGRLYDLGDELARRVDGQGRAELLIHGRRDGRLKNVSVQFASTAWLVSGMIDASDRTPPSRTSRLTVRLLDVTYSHWNELAVVEIHMEAPRRWPTPYRLEVDPSRLRAGHRYAVDARFTDRGMVILQTRAAVRVSPSEREEVVALTLAPWGNRPVGGIVPYDQITQWYERYLGRRPTERELTVWQSDLEQGRPLDDVQAGILSSSEFFERQQADRDRYVDEVYRALKGQTPTAEQHRGLLEQLDRQGDVRHRFVRELVKP